MAFWFSVEEIKKELDCNIREVIVKLKSGKQYFGYCVFLNDKIFRWYIHTNGISDLATTIKEDNPVCYWMPLPSPEKISEKF